MAGVSPMTVSRVINHAPRVSADTRRRVEAEIAELGYVPSRLARGLSGRNVRVLARVPFVLVDRSIAGFDADLVQGDSVAGARRLVEPRP